MPDSLDELYDGIVHNDSHDDNEEYDDNVNLFPDPDDSEDGDLDTEFETYAEPDYGDSEEGDEQEEEEGDADENEPEESNQQDDAIEESEVINDLLKAKGIENPAEINFEDENGELIKVNFYDLSYEEQMNILKSSDDISTLLDQGEIETINFLRKNGVSLEETIKYYERKAVEDYINSQNINGLEIDQYTDEDLYVLHLRNEYEDMTNDEIETDLQKQLEHPELFKKKVEKLRTEYKQIEEKQLEEARNQREVEDEQVYEDLKANLISIATNIEDVAGSGLDLDLDDKNVVLDHILKKDINGVSPFIKSLNSPEQLFELAWFAVKGKEAFNVIHDHYKKVIAETRRTAFDKGKESVQSSTQTQTPKEQPKSGRKSVVKRGAKPQSTRTNNNDNIMSIDDLSF